MKSTLELTKSGKIALMEALIAALEAPTSFMYGSDDSKYDVELVSLDGDVSKRRHVNMDHDVYNELVTDPDRLVSMRVVDCETGKTHTITPFKLYRAWWRLVRNERVTRTPGGKPEAFCHQSYALKLIALGLFGADADPTDAYTSDILVQIAVFGDVIYG